MASWNPLRWLRKSDVIVPHPESANKAVTAADVANSMGQSGNMPKQMRAALGGAFSGSQISNHREEALHYESFSYVAINAICLQLHSADVSAYVDGPNQKRQMSKRKSLKTHYGSRWKAQYGQDEDESDTLPVDHALMELLSRPNPHEPGGMFRYRQALQVRLTGGAYIWNCPNVFGRTCERYVIPTTAITPVFPTPALPFGGYRIQPNCMRWVPLEDNGYVEGTAALARVLGMVIDARFVQKCGFPHPIWLDDFQSPMSAGAQWVDAERAINVSRTSGVSRGLDPSILITLPDTYGDVNQDILDATQRAYDRKYGGPDNTGKAMVAAPGTGMEILGQSPKDMGYHEGFEDMKASVLALHNTPPVAIGLQEAGAYAAYNASLRQWGHTAIRPLCDLLAESDTFFLAPQFGEGITVEIEPEPVNDETETNARVQLAIMAKSITKNTVNQTLGFEPLDGAEGEKLAGPDAPVQGAGAAGIGGSGKVPAQAGGLPSIDTGMAKPPDLTNPFERDASASKTLQAAREGMREADDEFIESLVERAVESRLKARDQAKPRKFGSTQINLPQELANRVLAMGLMIPDDELADDGREDRIHATILFGLHASQPNCVRNAVSSNGPVTITLGKTSYFECDGFDVVKIDVISPQLVALHEVIADACENTQTHATYSPHVTCCYVRSGLGKKYAGIAALEGESFTADSFVFSNQSKQKFNINLKAETKSLGMSTSIGSDGGFTVPEESAYGTCPLCGGKTISRERRLNGNDICENGHVYPSRMSVMSRPATTVKRSKKKSFNPDQKRDESGKWTSGGSTHGTPEEREQGEFANKEHADAHAAEINRHLEKHGLPKVSVETDPTGGEDGDPIHKVVNSNGEVFADNFTNSFEDAHNETERSNTILKKHGLPETNVIEDEYGDYAPGADADELESLDSDATGMNEILAKYPKLKPVKIESDDGSYQLSTSTDLGDLQTADEECERANTILSKHGLKPSAKVVNDDGELVRDPDSPDPDELESLDEESTEINQVLAKYPKMKQAKIVSDGDGGYEVKSAAGDGADVDSLKETDSQITEANEILERHGMKPVTMGVDDDSIVIKGMPENADLDSLIDADREVTDVNELLKEHPDLPQAKMVTKDGNYESSISEDDANEMIEKKERNAALIAAKQESQAVNDRLVAHGYEPKITTELDEDGEPVHSHDLDEVNEHLDFMDQFKGKKSRSKAYLNAVEFLKQFAKSSDPTLKSERWITIGGDKDPDGDGGGTHVKIDDDGKIVAGPAGLADKGIQKLSDFGKKTSEEPSKPEEKPREFEILHDKNDAHNTHPIKGKFTAPDGSEHRIVGRGQPEWDNNQRKYRTKITTITKEQADENERQYQIENNARHERLKKESELEAKKQQSEYDSDKQKRVSSREKEPKTVDVTAPYSPRPSSMRVLSKEDAASQKRGILPRQPKSDEQAVIVGRPQMSGGTGEFYEYKPGDYIKREGYGNHQVVVAVKPGTVRSGEGYKKWEQAIITRDPTEKEQETISAHESRANNRSSGADTGWN